MPNTREHSTAPLEQIYAELERQNEQIARLFPEFVAPGSMPKSEGVERSHLTMRRV